MTRSASSFIRRELKLSNSTDDLLLNNSLNISSSVINSPTNGAANNTFGENNNNRSFSPNMFSQQEKRPSSRSAMNRSRIDAPLPPPTLEQLRAASPVQLARSTSPIMNITATTTNSSPIKKRSLQKSNKNNNNAAVKNRIDKSEFSGRSASELGVSNKNRFNSPPTNKKVNNNNTTTTTDSVSKTKNHNNNNSSKNHSKHHITTYNSNYTSIHQNTFVPPKTNSSFNSLSSPTNSSNSNNNSNGSVFNGSSVYGTMSSPMSSPMNGSGINHSFSNHNSKHVPVQLRDLDYSKSNDVLEIVKDKIHQLSPSLPEAFRRIKQATGYTGNKVKSDDFKKAIIKDFHLLDEVPNDLPNFTSVQHYQQEQVKKIDEFIRMADPHNEGYFGYSDFNRAMEMLEKYLSHHSTIAKSRYCGTNNHEAIRRKLERNEQQIERLMKMDKAPYGVHDDLVHSLNQSNQTFSNKLESLRSAFYNTLNSSVNTSGVNTSGGGVNGTSGGVNGTIGNSDDCKIPLTLFRETLKKYDSYILDVDLDQMIESLNGKRRGYILLNEFMNAYGFETIKSKSFRGSYESIRPLQWPATLESVDNHQQKKIKRSVKKKNSSTGRMVNNRTSVLRAEENRRNSSSALSNYSSANTTASSSNKQQRSFESIY